MELVAVEKQAAVRSRGVYPQLWQAGEFLDWLEDKVFADLIGGQIFMHSPVSFRHAVLLNFVDRLLASFVIRQKLGQLHRESVAVQFDERNVFMPDLCLFSNEQVARLPDNYADVVPRLIVEALSPRTAKRDTGIKFAVYERHGVEEYWILDPQKKDHRFYRRQGKFLIEFAKGEARVNSQVVPSFYLLREWLDPVDPPDPLDCLKEILGGSL